MHLLKSALLATPLILAAATVSAQTVTPYGPAPSTTDITTPLLAPGSGITILGGSYIGAANQGGTFTGFNLSSTDPGEPTLTVPNGVVLTSGTALFPNTNTSTNFGTTTGTGANAQLSALSVSAGGTGITNDQNVINLTFTLDNPANNAVTAQFLFASEEFPDQSITDIFGFFVDGVNYAKFSDGSLVSFQSGNAGFFNNNTNGSYSIEYDGLSNLLTVTALVDPAIAVHTLAIAIADTNDTVYDSAVFLSGLKATTSTGGGGINIPVPGPIAGAGLPTLLAFGGLVWARRRKAAA